MGSVRLLRDGFFLPDRSVVHRHPHLLQPAAVFEIPPAGAFPAMVSYIFRGQGLAGGDLDQYSSRLDDGSICNDPRDHASHRPGPGKFPG